LHSEFEIYSAALQILSFDRLLSFINSLSHYNVAANCSGNGESYGEKNES